MKNDQNQSPLSPVVNSNNQSILSPSLPKFSYIKSEDIDEELNCPICLDPFLEPVVLKCCQHTLCKKCADDCPYCPLCRQTHRPYADPPRLVTNMLSRINVTCLVCSSIVKRDSFQKHVQEVCPISCPNNCGVLQTRAGVEKHLEVCSHHIVPCEATVVGCSFTGKRFEIEEHQSKCSVNAQKLVLLRIQSLEEKVQKQEKVIDELLNFSKPSAFVLPLISAAYESNLEKIQEIENTLTERERNEQWLTLDDKLLEMIHQQQTPPPNRFQHPVSWFDWIDENEAKIWFGFYKEEVLKEFSKYLSEKKEFTDKQIVECRIATRKEYEGSKHRTWYYTETNYRRSYNNFFLNLEKSNICVFVKISVHSAITQCVSHKMNSNKATILRKKEEAKKFFLQNQMSQQEFQPISEIFHRLERVTDFYSY